jgi:hypothetical protein
VNSPALRLTDHAVVRLVERHVDEVNVLALRRRGLCERQIAAYLRITHATAIDAFVGRAQAALDRRRPRFFDAMRGVSYTVVLDHVPLVIADDRCITVLPDRREGRRRAA